MPAVVLNSTVLSRVALAAALLLGAGLLVSWRAPAAEQAALIAPPAIDSPKSAGPAQTAVLSGGCFWGMQGVFEHVRGVRRVVSGYAGGAKGTADYGSVSTGSTGHAESVQISFDPAAVSYGEILRVFFSVAHDPTQLNRQGPDVGTQYRSSIFYVDETQKRIAEAYISQLDSSRAFSRPIVTRVDPLKGFYPAEDYHQDYLYHNPSAPYIAMYDIPKVENFKHLFPELYSGRPVLASAK